MSRCFALLPTVSMSYSYSSTWVIDATPVDPRILGHETHIPGREDAKATRPTTNSAMDDLRPNTATPCSDVQVTASDVH
ncbi:hypothetical protein BDZ89DRAFT_1067791 [Hymenopellis radicata]|nr:hypothetical protein BDZ89DRAFT_1067791 [Hymenopellis radicata]